MPTTGNIAEQALVRAREAAERAGNWIELHNAIFGIGGILTELAQTPQDRTALAKSPEFAEITGLIDALRGQAGDPSAIGDQVAKANGKILVRVPRAIHAALLAEADTEGVSLNQLCVAKLSAQLKSVV